MSEKKRFWIYQEVPLEFYSLITVFLIFNLYTGFILVNSVIFRKKTYRSTLLHRILRLVLNEFSDVHMAVPCDLLMVYENSYFCSI